MAETSPTAGDARDIAGLRQWVWASLRAAGPRQPSIESLIDLLDNAPDLFYRLATCGVEDAAEGWAQSLAKLAMRVRALVLGGFDIQRGDRLVVVTSGSEVERFEVGNAQEASAVVAFFHRLSGSSTSDGVLKDFDGTAVSEAELEFKLGRGDGWQADAAHVSARMELRPTVVRLDDADRKSVEGGLPGYVAYGLCWSVTELLQTAQVRYLGLRRSGTLERGTALCGRLSHCYDNAGQRHPAPEGMLYVVYIDPEGYVFDWDWVKEDPHHPGYPIDSELRFNENPQPASEAVLVGIEGITPGEFNPREAWYSRRGDCVFCYFSDAPAFAERINDDLTVFKSFVDETATGFKIKNFERILRDLPVKLASPDISISVETPLLATIGRNPETADRYPLLIQAWMKRPAGLEPPRVKLPRELASIA